MDASIKSALRGPFSYVSEMKDTSYMKNKELFNRSIEQTNRCQNEHAYIAEEEKHNIWIVIRYNGWN